MLLKLMFLMLVWHRAAASDDLLDALAGARGTNRLSLCMRAPEDQGEGAARCAGALWRPHWLLARASCLDHRPLYKVLVLRDSDGVSCDDIDRGN